MGGAAIVFDVQSMKNAIQELLENKKIIFETCNNGLNQARQLLEETEGEKKISKIMLDAAVAVEIEKRAIVTELEMKLLAAYAELAAASSNPVLYPAIIAEIASINSQLVIVKQEHEVALRHKRDLERRYNMAIKCVNLALVRLEDLELKFESGKRTIETKVSSGSARLHIAYQDLTQYISRIAPDVRYNLDKWLNEKSKKNIPAGPSKIRDKFDIDDNLIDAILEYLYTTDRSFHENIDGYCKEISLGAKESVELKIKKHMVGRLCEEIVIRAFMPFSTNISIQVRESFLDGSYTKVDMIVYGLTKTLLLDQGEGIVARKGGNLAVEVKSGDSAYLYQQIKNMQDKAIEYKDCDVSCIICTRDIKDLPSEKENELRNKLRMTGLIMIDSLPSKNSLDSSCINFVKEKLINV